MRERERERERERARESREREREREREPKMRRTRKASEGGEAGIEGPETTRVRFFFFLMRCTKCGGARWRRHEKGQ